MNLTSIERRLNALERTAGPLTIRWRCPRCKLAVTGPTLYRPCGEHVVVPDNGRDTVLGWQTDRTRY